LNSIKGLDLLGTAQTGTGKTAAFVLSLLQRLSFSSNNLHHLQKGTFIEAFIGESVPVEKEHAYHCEMISRSEKWGSIRGDYKIFAYPTKRLT
jgi:hypothetical protein